MIAGLIASIALSGSFTSTDPHPVIDFSSDDLMKVVQNGFDAAPKLKDINQYMNAMRKGIGSIRTAPLRSETVSWFWWIHPKLTAFQLGFTARKKYFSDEEFDQKKLNLTKSPFGDKKLIVCEGALSIFPSFGGAYGSIDRVADPSDLKGVRVVMKVGEKIYQPIRQPGDLTADSGVASSSVFIPQSSTTTVNSSGTATAVGPGGTATANGSSTATITNYYTVERTESYNWFAARFLVGFDAYEEDGTPRLTKDDKEVTFIIIYGPNERKATYKLNDVANLFK